MQNTVLLFPSLFAFGKRSLDGENSVKKKRLKQRENTLKKGAKSGNIVGGDKKNPRIQKISRIIPERGGGPYCLVIKLIKYFEFFKTKLSQRTEKKIM